MLGVDGAHEALNDCEAQLSLTALNDCEAQLALIDVPVPSGAHEALIAKEAVPCSEPVNPATEDTPPGNVAFPVVLAKVIRFTLLTSPLDTSSMVNPAIFEPTVNPVSPVFQYIILG